MGIGATLRDATGELRIMNTVGLELEARVVPERCCRLPSIPKRHWTCVHRSIL